MKDGWGEMSAAEYLSMAGAGQGKAANPVRRLQGARNREDGALFEQMLSVGCAYYAKLGLAKVEKTPEPVKVLSGMDAQGRFTACFEKKAQGDYTGTLAGGRSIAFEAKCTTGQRIEQRVVTDPQRDWMQGHYQMGAACFVMVGMITPFIEAYRVPWALWRDMKAHYGRKYMTAEDLKPFAVPVGIYAGEGCVKFLEGMVDA